MKMDLFSVIYNFFIPRKELTCCITLRLTTPNHPSQRATVVLPGYGKALCNGKNTLLLRKHRG